MRRPHLTPTAAMLLACAATAVHAAGLQVSPVSLRLEATQQADGLWLSNTGGAVLHAQVRVFRWTQEGGQDQLLPTDALQVSPPMLELPAGGRQLVRVIRSGPAAATGIEQTYRLLVDELPLETPERPGLQFVMRHSLPVFLEPSNATPTPPQLQFTLQLAGEHVVLQAHNSGGTAAQLADLRFTNASGQLVQAHSGLLGYVLPGATMQWALKQAPETLAGARSWQLRINGNDGPQDIAMPAAAH